jgi:hypothetical protein
LSKEGEVYTVEKYVFKFINILLSFSLYQHHSHNWSDIEKILWGALGEEHKFPLMAIGMGYKSVTGTNSFWKSIKAGWDIFVYYEHYEVGVNKRERLFD